jgi:hypothetical protein
LSDGSVNILNQDRSPRACSQALLVKYLKQQLGQQTFIDGLHDQRVQFRRGPTPLPQMRHGHRSVPQTLTTSRVACGKEDGANSKENPVVH